MAQINWSAAPKTGNPELDAFLDEILKVIRSLQLLGNDINIYAGTGTPEGVVTANVGSVFLRTDGSAGATVYAKSSGTGNTGWSALS